MSTDWDKELAKIDKQLASISDEELLNASAPPPVVAGVGAKSSAVKGAKVGREPRRWVLYLRLAIALALAVGILFWPHDMYSIACGPNLFLYLGWAGAITVAGGWSAFWSWRHRAGVTHVMSLAIMMWGLVVGASEVLPRIGYAKTPGDAPPTWLCQ